MFNTAIALGRLGVPVGMVTGISSDIFGQQLLADLAASHVGTGSVIRTDRPTTLAFVHLVDGRARYDFFDENSAGQMLTPADMPTVPDSATALFFGGISLAVEPGANAYAEMGARPRGDRVMMLDPNIRPGFIKDEAAYRRRIDGLIGLTDIVKISDEDLDWLSPSTASLGDRAAAFLARGPSLVIVTKGKDGAEGWLAAGGHVAVPGRVVGVADTVGAGDTFNAGVLAALSMRGLLTRTALRGLSRDALQSALDLGATVAAVTVSRSGANPPWAQEISLQAHVGPL